MQIVAIIIMFDFSPHLPYTLLCSHYDVSQQAKLKVERSSTPHYSHPDMSQQVKLKLFRSGTLCFCLFHQLELFRSGTLSCSDHEASQVSTAYVLIVRRDL